jgi:hypothetical protein
MWKADACISCAPASPRPPSPGNLQGRNWLLSWKGSTDIIDPMSDSTAGPAAVPEKTTKAECAQCGGKRNCAIKGEYADSYNDEYFWAQTTWYILQCRGCDYVFVQTVAVNSEDVDYYAEQDGSTGSDFIKEVKYWPALSERKKPEWMSEAGIDAQGVDTLDAAMKELYGALDNDLRMLAGIGIRTTYDVASGLLGIDENLAFSKKLDALVSSGRIGIVDKERLTTLVDAGSASAHRGWKPKPSDLSVMMDVLEHFIHDSFVAPAQKKKLDAEAAKVKETVPRRAHRRKAEKNPEKE